MLISPDVVSLREFYASPLGTLVRRDVGAAIARHWHNNEGESVIGLGFALPYLGRFLRPDQCVLSIMFPHIGAMYWPVDSENHTVLSSEGELPLEDNSLQRVLMCHAAEHSLHLTTLMNEVFRVLAPGGKALYIVPNRQGLWSSRTNNPFGFGHPYHMAQIRHRAELAGFTYIKASGALFYPPSEVRIMLRLAKNIERLGRLCLPHRGGVVLMEVEKQLYASIPEPIRRMVIPARPYPAGAAAIS